MYILRISGTLIRHCIAPLALSITVAVSGGCAVTPPQPDAATTSFADDWKNAQPGNSILPITDTKVTEDWWTQFNDVTLNQLVHRAQYNNLDIRLALNRIHQAQAQLGITEAQKTPQISGFGSAVREDISNNGKFAALGANPDGNEYWQAGVDISWELDLWGRLEYLSEGAKQGVNATIYDAAAVQVLLRANVVSTYFALRGAQQQLLLTEREHSLSKQERNMIISQFKNGLTGGAKVAQAKAKVANLTAKIPPLEASVHQLMNQLALLTGEPPQALTSLLSETGEVPSLPASIPFQLNGDLARQRPDIMSASARLKQATAAIGVAQADFYPSISLNGRTGFEAFNTDALTNWDSAFFSVGPAVYLPIFEGGKLKRRLELTEQQQTAAAFHYRKTVLQAWHEVDDALSYLQALYAQHQAISDVYNELSVAQEHTKNGLAQGNMSQLDVIKANEQVVSGAQRLQQNQTQLSIALVTLYKALGGGWQPLNEPEDSGL